ncbi:MAG TPA: hypothetical protein V6D18_09945 [Thermosynechococcaceae cyanobacterium]
MNSPITLCTIAALPLNFEVVSSRDYTGERSGWSGVAEQEQ